IQHGRTPAGAVDVALLAEECASLHVDVLGLQEVDRGATRSGRADEAAEVAEAVGMACAFAEATSFEPGSAYGNALLVRGEVDDVEVRMLPGEEGDEPRALLLADVDVAGAGRLSVAVTHLSVRPRVALRQLEAVVGALALRPLPRLMMGDLNLRPEAAWPILEDAGLTVVDAPPAFPAHRPDRVIDHVAGEGVSFGGVEVVHLRVSDHRALRVDLAPLSKLVH
ncbi:MAG: endonuclease/exonuclease/phosphatase family protein, partial [Actinomycetota bacterium]